jgi:hypothetical protein
MRHVGDPRLGLLALGDIQNGDESSPTGVIATFS